MYVFIAHEYLRPFNTKYLQYSNVGLQIQIIEKANILAFEPPFKSFGDTLVKTIDKIIDAVMDIPRLETQLYMDHQGEITYLCVSNKQQKLL